MMSPVISLTAVLLWVALGALGLAIGLWCWAGRLRRRDGDPHCRRCDYNLRGTPGLTCPECGGSTARPFIGERRWYRPLRRVAMVCLLFAVGSGG